MFSFFKKKKQINPLGFEINPMINKTLSQEDKECIFHSMYTLMAAEGTVIPELNKFIFQQAKALEFDLELFANSDVNKFEDSNFAFQVLSKQSVEQKKYYSFALYSMLNDCGVKPTQNQIELYLIIGQKTNNPFMR